MGTRPLKKLLWWCNLVLETPSCTYDMVWCKKMNPKEIVIKYWQAWTEHNLESLLSLLAPEFVSRSSLSQGRPVGYFVCPASPASPVPHLHIAVCIKSALLGPR